MNSILDRDRGEYSPRELTVEILKVVALGTLVASMFVAPGMGAVYRVFDAEGRAEKQRLKRHLLKLKN